MKKGAGSLCKAWVLEEGQEEEGGSIDECVGDGREKSSCLGNRWLLRKDDLSERTVVCGGNEGSMVVAK